MPTPLTALTIPRLAQVATTAAVMAAAMAYRSRRRPYNAETNLGESSPSASVPPAPSPAVTDATPHASASAHTSSLHLHLQLRQHCLICSHASTDCCMLLKTGTSTDWQSQHYTIHGSVTANDVGCRTPCVAVSSLQLLCGFEAVANMVQLTDDLAAKNTENTMDSGDGGAAGHLAQEMAASPITHPAQEMAASQSRPWGQVFDTLCTCQPLSCCISRQLALSMLVPAIYDNKAFCPCCTYSLCTTCTELEH